MTHQQNPFPPGATPPGGMPVLPPPRKRTGLLLGVTLVVAVLALVVGVAGVALASMALGRSDRAVSLAGSVRSDPPPPPPTGVAPTPTGPQPTDPETVSSGGVDPSATPTEIDPSAQFTVAYQGQPLRVRSVACRYTNQTHVDLDEPRVLGDEDKGAEFGYSGCDPGQVVSTLPFAQVSGPNATPADCLNTVRTDPGRSPVAPTAKMTLCFLTSQDAAADQGISQKLVFVTINSVTVDNTVGDELGVLNVTAKAWNVPQ